MDLTNEQLICEAVECNHAGVGSSTLGRYRDHLVHFAQYLASVHKSDFYRANKKQVRLFMGHLEKQGGANPDPARLRCDWCKARGYPDGREGQGWSASYRKSYLSALRFLYHHFQADDELPDIDPTVLESSPRVIVKRGYTPSKEEIKRLLETEGPPRAVLLVHWLFYAPSRRKTYADARWCDIDLDAAEWEVVGKNGKVDIFPLAPPLLRAFRVYRRWQLSEAEHHPAKRDALSDPETAYVLMTSNGKKTSPSTVTKIATWHGIRAGVGLKTATPGIDAVDGMTSRVTPIVSAAPGPPSPSTTRRTRRRSTWCQRCCGMRRSRRPGATTHPLSQIEPKQHWSGCVCSERHEHLIRSGAHRHR